MNVLDTPLEKFGTKPWHQVDIIEEEGAEVLETFGGRVGVEPTAR